MNDRIDMDWRAMLALVRPLNLVFIGLTQYLLFFHFLFPVFHATGAPILLPGWMAVLFLSSTILLTAGGYAMNDLMDIETDRINKPGKWLVGNRVSRKTAVIFSSILFLLGAGAAGWIALAIGKPHLWFIYPGAALSLWAYSRFFKALPLAGNLLVAALCSLVGGIVWFAEMEGIGFLWTADPLKAQRVWYALVFYLYFAFTATLFREIVKDCEDVEGDTAAALRTLPARFGVQTAVRLAYVTGILLWLSLLALAWYFFTIKEPAGVAFSIGFLFLPLTFALVLLGRAKNPQQFRKISLIAKVVIFAGVFVVLFF